MTRRLEEENETHYLFIKSYRLHFLPKRNNHHSRTEFFNLKRKPGESAAETWKGLLKIETNRERPKSTPYLRPKNSKRTYNCKVFSSKHPRNQKLDRIGAPGKRFDRYHRFCRKLSKKLKGDTLVKTKMNKSLTIPKKLKGDLLVSFNIHSAAKLRKRCRQNLCGHFFV